MGLPMCGQAASAAQCSTSGRTGPVPTSLHSHQALLGGFRHSSVHRSRSAAGSSGGSSALQAGSHTHFQQQAFFKRTPQHLGSSCFAKLRHAAAAVAAVPLHAAVAAVAAIPGGHSAATARSSSICQYAGSGKGGPLSSADKLPAISLSSLDAHASAVDISLHEICESAKRIESEQKAEAAVESVSGWRQRWTVVLLCFGAFMLCNMDRVNMSVAILPMAQQYSWNSATVGLVQSSFFWGYLVTQIAGGVWADRFGGKLVLGLGVLWWSLATALTPVAASMGLPFLLFARALMGIGEGVAMPAMNNMLSRWVPGQERSRSLALVYSGMFMGSILGLGASPTMIHKFGWPSVFYIFGSMGVLWYLVWQAKVASTPAQDKNIAAAERSYIVANTCEGMGESESIPWKKLLSRTEVWAIIVCHFCHNYGTFILLTWMPSYYNQVLGLDLMSSGALSVLPWVTMALFANVGGWLADTMVDKGVSVTAVRKGMQTIGFLGPAFFLSQLTSMTSVPAAVACMMGAQGLDAFSQSGLYSNHQDIGPKYAGVLLGMSNTAGVLAGVVGSLATGYILQHAGWSQVWQVAIALYLVGTVIWNTFATGERIFD